jgi:hypothetical protein
MSKFFLFLLVFVLCVLVYISVDAIFLLKDLQTGVVNNETKSPLFPTTTSLSVTPLATSNKNSAQDTPGIIKGKANIGPICPVERIDEPCQISPEVYTSRQVAIYDETGKVELKKMNLKEDGTYSFELEPGEYVLDIIKTGMDRSPELPQPLTIERDKTKVYNFSIDTGIR